ncbi:starvation-inducible DNA-binding protein [Synechococcus sp. Ace-Pa]|nr:starvation-inducible DNA-binding protein [Synechococcus sp. Ace-Pa]
MKESTIFFMTNTLIAPTTQTANSHGKNVAGLKQVLADTYVLYSKTHGFHWNVTGPMFTSLHALFMEQYTELFEAIDELAERIRVLRVEAPYGAAALSRLSSLCDASGSPDAMAMVRELEADHRHLAAHCQKALAQAQETGDEGSADLLTQRLRTHQKTAWKLASLLQ